MTVIFTCRRNRLRDIALIRLGIASAGHRLLVLVLPWGFPLLLLCAMLRLLGRRTHLIISDSHFGDTVVAWLFGKDSTRIMWNYADEWAAERIRLPRHKVCFFREAGFDIDVFPFAPQPLPNPGMRRQPPFRPILFLGDVTAEIPNLPENDLWHKKFSDLHDSFGFTFYLRHEYERAIAEKSTLYSEQRAARVLAKNLLRLWIVRAVHRHFGERLIVVGSNWRVFGMSAESSIYDETNRLRFYRSAIVNLDCGSKSGNSVLYPRSSELVSFSGGLLQVRCADTDNIFEERAPEFSFATDVQLIERIEERLAEPPSRRSERDEWLVRRLRDGQLLMQHSIDQLLSATRRER